MASPTLCPAARYFNSSSLSQEPDAAGLGFSTESHQRHVGSVPVQLVERGRRDMLGSYVNPFALSFISFQADKEIYLPELRPYIKSILTLLSTFYYMGVGPLMNLALGTCITAVFLRLAGRRVHLRRQTGRVSGEYHFHTIPSGKPDKPPGSTVFPTHGISVSFGTAPREYTSRYHKKMQQRIIERNEGGVDWLKSDYVVYTLDVVNTSYLNAFRISFCPHFKTEAAERHVTQAYQ
ncbi:uncharacterized protein PITG_12625 [Phytophthora infestans T30-4]|uniref:Transmembrane protein n=1 Tax=Phytophthora infestans (strain T30-4) TaxID=403677 RepID=D0NNE5_PHYIT|nr:uncharacterized protein PITG_12625 [Phytophthora infestans T30-4]EEY62081.1 conserved hypothetical protein [Phytophthora infestans T30-4]|eukprot:XP_002899385.1 conserved hypothetical protein [Phytophthora infestans T30-4]